MKKIRDFLTQLGLSDAETTIYLKLLELGKCSVSELAHAISMNRVTVHFTVQGLIDKGLITHVKEGRSRELTAQPPDALKYLLDEREKEVTSLHEQFTSALPLLTGLMPQKAISDKQFDVKFYEGIAGVKAIYREIFKTTILRAYANIERITTAVPENLSLFPEANKIKHVEMREIIEDSDKSRQYLKNMGPVNYSYRFFPKSLPNTIFDYLIFDDKIGMVSGEKDLNGIMIINQDLTDNAKALFDMLWNLLPAN